MRPICLALVVIQAMIVTKLQILNCGSKAYCWSFNTLKKKVTCVRETSLNSRKHFDMSVRTISYLRLGAYGGSKLEWHTTQPTLMQLWQKIILNPSSIAICKRWFSNKMKSETTCTLSWTWGPLMLLCGSLFLTWSRCNGLSYHLQHLEKHARTKDTYARLIVLIVTNQDWILIIQNINNF